MKANGPRVSAKAIVIYENKLLVIKKCVGGMSYYILPGGGQNRFEALFDALTREVMEETGYTVTPEKILFIRDYIGKNHEFAESQPHVHQLEVHILATLLDVPKKEASELDDGQTGLEWIELSELHSYPIFPKSIKTLDLKNAAGLYLGDVN